MERLMEVARCRRAGCASIAACRRAFGGFFAAFPDTGNATFCSTGGRSLPGGRSKSPAMPRRAAEAAEALK
jgi:hypothetical protein